LTSSETARPAGGFSLVAGGPFHRLLRSIGLLGADQLPTWRTAVVLALLAWLPLALFAVIQTLVDASYTGWGFFSDLTVYTRYLIAIGVMIVTERYADGRFVILARHFREARLLADDNLPAFEAALAVADRRANSVLAEGIIVSAALVLSGLTAGYAVEIAGSSWEGAMLGGEVVLSWAGVTERYLAGSLFLFLVFRWIWRFVVWGALLFRLSRLPLQLTPLHSDRAAGLGFLSIYPSIYSGFVFALSCVVAASMLKDLGLEGHSAEFVWFAIGGWIAFALVLFLGPMFVFAAPLYRARERALIEYGRLTSQHHLAFHKKWISAATPGENLMGSPDPSSASDLNAALQAVRDIRLAPIDAVAVVQTVAAAGIPMLAVVATQMPLGDLFVWLVGAVL
jgi:hypothetical protein